MCQFAHAVQFSSPVALLESGQAQALALALLHSLLERA